jgi:hypothetical protein
MAAEKPLQKFDVSPRVNGKGAFARTLPPAVPSIYVFESFFHIGDPLAPGAAEAMSWSIPNRRHYWLHIAQSMRKAAAVRLSFCIIRL